MSIRISAARAQLIAALPYDAVLNDHIASALVATQFPNVPIHKVNIRNLLGSPLVEYVGAAGVSLANGFSLAAGEETGWLELDNLNRLYHIAQVSSGASLEAESLTSPTDFSVAAWTHTGDFGHTGAPIVFTYSSGAGTLTQASGSMARPGVASQWYKLVAVISASNVVGATMVLTTAFAESAVPIPVTAAGTITVWFKSAAAPGNFVLSVSGATSGSFTMTSLSLKQVLGGIGGLCYLAL